MDLEQKAKIKKFKNDGDGDANDDDDDDGGPCSTTSALRKEFDEQQSQTLDPFSTPECSSAAADDQRAAQKLKCFTQAEVIAADSDSAGDGGDAYDADVDDVFDDGRKKVKSLSVPEPETPTVRVQNEREHIYELFQPWALRTYGDQAKTKTITLRKKARILKALEGKEHSRPDSSKFRFWVKSKAFTTKRPEGFAEIPGSQRKAKPFPPGAVLSESPGEVDLFVASTSKDFGKRIHRKVAVVEEFFDIIYNVHMELGGRSGMHAGQKRTYRIITETYAFLPREAVTRFLSTCPECKKNLRPSTPSNSSGQNEEPNNDSSSEVEALNYSSHTESSVEAGPTKASVTTRTAPTTRARKRRHSQQQIIFTQHKQKRKEEKGQQQQQQQLLKERPLQPTPAAPTAAHPLNPAAVPTVVGPHKNPSASADSSKTKSSPFHLGGSPPTATAGPSPFPGLLSTIPLFPNPSRPNQDEKLNVNLPKIRLNPYFQRRRRLSSPTLMATAEPVPTLRFPSAPFNPQALDFASFKTQESLFRYYEFMRRFYGDSTRQRGLAAQSSIPVATPPIQLPLSTPVPTPPLYGPAFWQSLSLPAGDNERTKLTLATPPSETEGARPLLESVDKKAHSKGVNDPKHVFVGPLEPTMTAVTPTLKKLKLSNESEPSVKMSAVEEGTRSILKIPSTTQQTSSEQQQHLHLHHLQQQQQQQQQQGSAINLSKSSHFRSNGGASATPTTTATATSATSATSAPATALAPAIKVECPSSGSTYAALTISGTCQSSALVAPSAGVARSLRIPNVMNLASCSSGSSGAAATSRTVTMPHLLPPLDLDRLKPITSTYLQLTRSMGLSDEDALRFDNLVSEDFKYSL